MWNKLNDFYNNNKYAIWWTGCYILASWAVMRYMFNFNIFSAYRWHQLFHAHLHGFAGFVFAVLILAMVPLYIATTAIIARTKTPLVNIKITIPEFIRNYIKNAFIQTPMTDDEPAPVDTPQIESEQIPDTAAVDDTAKSESPTPIPDTVPSELRVAYIRARDNISRTPTSAYDLGNMTKPTPAQNIDTAMVPTESDSDTLPIPTDFDISDTDRIINDVPIFTDIDLDDDDDENDDTSDAESQPDNLLSVSEDNDNVVKYLTAKSVPYGVDGDVIVTDKFAIVSHTDPDFWVADNESWFAAGKIRRSPIVSVLKTAKTHNVQPVLYLGADNIMDIDELRNTWESAGIRIITNLKDLI